MTMSSITLRVVLALAALFAATGPSYAQMDPAPANPDLRPVLAQFGGEPGLVAVVDDFLHLMQANPRIAHFFVDIDEDLLKRHLVDQFCVILGGDCQYGGRDMLTSHAGLGINRADFNALVEDLQTAMSRHGVPFRAQNRLLAELAPMHRDILSD